MGSKIEWTDETDNIIRVAGGGYWCRRISPGCENCYAAKLNQNPFFGGNGLDYRGWAPAMVLRQELVDGWAKKRAPKRHFVASMTDVFGEWVPKWMVHQFLDGMLAAPKQTFQVLTKRPGVANNRIAEYCLQRGLAELPGNIWIGTSVEDQKRAEERIPQLLEVPTKVRFLSCEPLLGPLDFDRLPFGLAGIHWVIVGGESGPGARPMHPDWARSLRDQCQTAGVPFFFKQWGNWKPICEMPDGEVDRLYVPNRRAKDGEDQEVLTSVYGRRCTVEATAIGYGGVTGMDAFWVDRCGNDGHSGMQVFNVGKKRAGRLLDGREWNEMPEVLAQ